MDQKIKEATRQAGGAWGIHSAYLDNNEEIYKQNENEKFYAASVAKVSVAACALSQAEQGKLKLDDTMKLGPDYRRPGTGVLRRLSDGLELKIKDLIIMMLMISDNVAAKMLVSKLGVANINAWLESVGLNTSRLEQLEGSQFTFGDTTPAEMAQILRGIYKQELVNKENSEFLLSVMVDCHFTAGIRRYLPMTIGADRKLLAANKEGTFEDSRHDVAIVQADRPYVLVILSKGLEDQSYGVENKGVHAIANISKAIYEARA